MSGLLLAIVILLASFSTVNAQESSRLSLTTSPLPVSLVGKPGETVKTDLRLRNSGDKTEEIKVGLMKFAIGANSSPEILDRGPSDEYFDWVTFSEDEFTIQPNETKAITMTIELPPKAALGYYYAVTFSRAESAATSGTQAAVEGATAIIVLLEAKVPSAKRDVVIERFAVNSRVYEFLPASFTVKLKNKGNIHLAASGNIFISRNGKQLGTIDVNRLQGNILPGSSREFSAEWSDGFPRYQELTDQKGVTLDKDGKPVQKLDWNFNTPLSKLRFGKYTATLLMAYSDGDKDVPLEATVTFWVIPWRIIGTILLIAILLIGSPIAFLRLRKRLRPRAGKEDSAK
jgi:hypothetical protein